MPSAILQKAIGVVHRAFQMPPSWMRRLGGPALTMNGTSLEPQSQLAWRLSKLADGKPIEARSVRGARAALLRSARMDPPRPSLARVEDQRLDLPVALGCRVYTPIGAGPSAPALIYFHGGGWTIGSIDTVDGVCARLAAHAGCVVISVDYRLAPEHRFPAAVDDALGAFDLVRRTADQFGVDPRRIAVGGDSAGGNLAAVVANQRRAEVAYQLLIYPATDATVERPSYEQCPDGLFLTAATVRWFRAHYVAAEQHADPRVSPILEPSLVDVPPACVAVVGFDPLRDEGLAYAERLDEAGSLDLLIDKPSLLHGGMSMLGFSPESRDLVDQAASAIARRMATISPSSEGPSPE